PRALLCGVAPCMCGLDSWLRSAEPRLRRNGGPIHASSRTPVLQTHDTATPAALSRRHPPSRLACAVAGGLGPGAAHGPDRDHAAAGRATTSRSAQLELARVWHARRLLAHAQNV